MRRIDFDVLSDWCRRSGYELRDWVPHLSAPREKLRCGMPTDIQELPSLLDVVVNLGPRSDERVLWLRDWTIWNERSQEIGLKMVDLIAGTVPHIGERDTAQAYILSGDEWREAIALLTVPMLFGWDAHFLYGSGSVLIDVTHHSEIVASFSSNNESAAAQFRRWC
jgi:hypothetical protein